MKIVNIFWQRQIELEENKIHTLVFENKNYYKKVVYELKKQHDGCDGRFVLSKNDKEISFSKYSHLITSLFDVDVNSKKILTKIYANLQKDVNEDVVEYNKVISNIEEYFERLIFNNSLDIDYGLIDIVAFLKLGAFQVTFDEKNYLERVVKYIKLMAELCGVKVFFIVGTHTFFNNEELELFYKEMCLNKINIINIESQVYPKIKSDIFKEEIFIFDEDNCEI